MFNKKEIFSVKKKLKQLYMNTHPDFFVESPKQQKINQDSLSLLQNFMDDYKTENNFKLTSKSYLFQFYMKNEIDKLIQLNLKGPQPNTGSFAFLVYFFNFFKELLKNKSL